MNVSMVDIAQKPGISQSTVSLAQNNSPKASAATIESCLPGLGGKKMNQAWTQLV